MFHNVSFAGIGGFNPQKTHNPFSHGLRFSGKQAGPDFAPITETQTTAPVLTHSSLSQSSQSQNSFSLTVKTRDGDLVTLDIINQQGRT